MVRTILTALLLVSLAACHDGNSSANTVDVPTTIPTSTTGSPPTLSGNPVTAAMVGSSYSFTPTAQDPDGQPLSFSIQNKPAWTQFDSVTGKLSGTPAPANVGTTTGIVISVTDGSHSAALGPFTIRVAAPANTGPVISGAPRTSIAVGQAYSFTPSSSDGSGDPLTFTIVNKPSWANFNETTGQLSGTPTAGDVGMSSGIVISASDGTSSASLASFNISVTQIGAGAATLSWVPPTQNVDGTALTDLAGYRVHYGLTSAAMSQSVDVTNPGVTTYVVSNLSPATWYFTVKAYNSKNVESDNSAVVSKVIQ